MTAAARSTAGSPAVFTDRVRGTADWDAPAPVEGWAARDVVGHLVDVVPGVPRGRGRGRPSRRVRRSTTTRWPPGVAHADGVQALLDDPATAGRGARRTRTSARSRSTRRSTAFYTADVFMHTWDLARATGQDETLDPEKCAVMLAGMEPMDDVLRASGQYGPRVEVPTDAQVQDRLIGFIGRDPRRISA